MNLRKSSLVRQLFLVVLLSASKIDAQEHGGQAPPREPDIVSPASKSPASDRIAEHRFWDKENCWLFAGVGAARTLDYFSTLNMRRRGRQEILLSNDVVDNHAAFGAIEAASTGASIGASYLFHRYGHHKLERWTSVRAYRTDDHGRGSELLPENG